ncbi:MAG: 1-acyl-sn-glycerol-3-phosphate acyltransferase [Candidatus Heimdallarchaeota archaeon]|nr:1-acyl-sn-glycerol-3-phosphate acyltransferase [Candidatus Heimdallarchaeota archaeon]
MTYPLNSKKYAKKRVPRDVTSVLNFQKGLDGNKTGPCDYFNYNFKTKPYFYAIIKPLVKIMMRIGWNYSVEGKENIPKGRNVIFMPNHVSHFDSFLVGSYYPTTPIGIIDEKLFKNRIFSVFARLINGFPVRKGTKSIEIVKYAISRVNKGDSMLWFPEGQRHKNPKINRMMEGKLGSGMLAHGATVPIIPVFISGAEFAMPVGRKLTIGVGPRSIKIKVKFGKPVYLEDLRARAPSKESSQLVLGRIMAAIEELRPEGPYVIQKTRIMRKQKRN